MTPYITKDKQRKLTPAIDQLLWALGELECDNDELTNSTEDNLSYIIMKLLERTSTYSPSAIYTALGMLEGIKAHYIQQYLYPHLQQSKFEVEIDDQEDV